MRLLLDSHTLLWWLEGLARLPTRVQAILSDDDTEAFVSAASAWEICTKYRIGKLPQARGLAIAFEASVVERGFRLLSITVAHAERAGMLEGRHKDPFDRILIAQSLIDELTLVSNERAFDAFGVSRLW